MDGKLYFAYGSNIDLNQMAYRCPDAEAVSPVTLDNYELLFRKGGIATIAPKEGSIVHGLLWKITPKCEQALDQYESYPHLYEKQDVTVRDRDGQTFTVMVYIMTGDARQMKPFVPSGYYYDGIMDGYIQNGLPAEALKEAKRNAQREVNAMKQKKPSCPLVGANGNVFNLMAIAAKTLNENGMEREAQEMTQRIMGGECQNYNEALIVIMEYVEVTNVPEKSEKSQKSKSKTKARKMNDR